MLNDPKVTTSKAAAYSTAVCYASTAAAHMLLFKVTEENIQLFLKVSIPVIHLK